MELDPKSFAAALIEEMKASGHAMWIDPEAHSEQHQFVAEMIAERKERTARRKRVEEMITGSVLLSGLLLVIGLIGAGALSWLRSHT